MALRITETDTAIQRDLEDLIERIAPLAECCEQTLAAFQVLRARWQADAAQLHEALTDIAATVGGRR